jgi:RNA polymerase sigma-70 factor (ECF subfamily)
MDTCNHELFLLTAAPANDALFLERFHAGDRTTLEACYEDHFATVERAVGRVLRGVDGESVVQDVFCRLVASEPLRRSFRGGSLAGWLAVVARNQAIDVARRRQLEMRVAVGEAEAAEPDQGRFSDRSEAELLVERFRREVLPAKWAPVFQARFLDQLSQREAAQKLSMRRTTLAYQELRIHALLRGFLLQPPAGEQGES